MKARAMIVLLAIAIASTASLCGTTINNQLPAAPSPTPTPTPVADTIEFRIFGQVGVAPVLIKYTNSIDGSSILSAASLPYIVSIKSLEASIFLDLEASAAPLVGAGSSLQAQIYVNGRLFREATASGVTPLSVSASGTWRR